jgi:two-component system, sensor histidine kinase and response regulator
VSAGQGPRLQMNHGYQRRLGWLAGLLHASLLAAQVPSPVAPADGTASSASAPAVLTRVADIRSLSPERAAQRQPVRITGVITYHFADWNELFVQDETSGIYVAVSNTFPAVQAGDRVEILGTSDPGHFAPLIQAREVRRLETGELPPARPVTVQELRGGGHDSQWVELRATIHSARHQDGMLVADASDHSGKLTVRLPGTPDPGPYEHAAVRLRGVVASKFNERRELTGLELRVPAVEFIEIELPAPTDLFALPVTTLLELRQFRASTEPPALVKIRGVVTLRRPDGTFFLQDKTRAALVTPQPGVRVAPGELVEVVGYPSFQVTSALMQGAAVRHAGHEALPPPVVLSETTLLDGANDQLWAQIEGRLIGESHRPNAVVYLVQFGEWVIAAISPHQLDAEHSAPPLQSKVRITGVLQFERDLTSHVRMVHLALSDPRSLEVTSRPSVWTRSRLQTLAVIAGCVLVFATWRTRVMARTNTRLRREVEERQHTERALARKQTLLQALMEHSPDYIYFKDTECRFVQVNRATALKFGFSAPESMIGLSDADLFAEVSAAEFRADELKVIQTGQPIVAKEEREVHHDGTIRWMQTTTMPHRDETETICGVIGIARDITGRKLAEAEIAQQKQHYQVMFDAMPALVMYKDTCNRALRINRFGAALLGLPAAEIEGRSLFELDPEHAAHLYEDDLEIIRTGTPKLGCEEIVGGADGRTLWLRTDRLPDRDAQGRIVGVIVFAVDITPQKPAEQALLEAQGSLEQKVRSRTAELVQEVREREEVERRLREQDRFIRTVIDTDPNMIFVKDQEGRYTLVNEASAAFSGLTPAEKTGRRSREVFPDSESVTKIEHDDQLVWQTGRELVTAEERLTNRRGETRWFQTIKRPLRGEQGEITHLLGVAVDITERKRRVEELQRAQSFLTAVVENLPISVFIKEAADLRFVLWNKAGEALTGYSNAEMMGKNDHDFFPPEVAARFIEDDRRALANGKLVDVPAEPLDTRHRGRRLVHTRKIPILDEQGRPQYLLGIAEDITERKQAEEELEQARDAAEAANRAKSEFLANMSHEIRTPMNGVIGMTNLLLASELNAEQLDYAEQVRRSAEGLLTIINDILDFSKIEAGKLHFEHLDFDLSEVVEDSLDMVAEAAASKRLELGALIAPGVTGALRGDPGRLRQVLLNLLGNAVKFTEHGEVALEVTQLEETAGHVRLRFEVTDTGIGIEPAVRRRLFQAFTQADASTTRKHGGTGLGLVISRQLVGMMDGEMNVRSEPGRGSTFWFTVRLEQQPPEVRHERERVRNLTGARALIVDDNPLNRRILQHHLDAWGMEHQAVASGAEALTALRAAVGAGKAFNMVILDMQMPEMDGLMTAEAIRAEPSLRPAALILLSSLGQPVPAPELRQRGIQASLVKPVKQRELYNCLANLLAGESGTTFRPRRQPRVASERIKPKNHLRILVAEDNPVNQKVATRTLQKLGYQADCVGNGREALAAIESILYDVILMDCNMPEMDGYEATRAIRALGGIPQPRIIAMTANAMVGDREKCLASGMDSYLSKPLREHELDKALASVAALEPVARASTKRPTAARTTEPKAAAAATKVAAQVDAEAINRLRELGEPGGPDIVGEFIDLYVSDGCELLARICQSLAPKDDDLLRRHAHTLKGSSRNMGADTVAEIAGEIENKADTAATAELTVLCQQLEAAFEATIPLLQAHKHPPVTA